MALLVKPDGSNAKLTPKNGKTFTLEELQTAVGGYIEMVPQDQFKGFVYCDEEGKVKTPPKMLNRTATQMCYPTGVREGYELVGDVLFLDESENDE